jgi:transcription initiation factor TFIIB
MKTKLGIPNNVVENAAYIYRKAVNAKLARGRTMNSLIAASLYAACRENNIPRTLDDIAKAGNVERRILSRDLRTIIKKLELHLNQYDTTSFISKISNNMNLKGTDYCWKTPCSTSCCIIIHFMHYERGKNQPKKVFSRVWSK